MNIIIKGSHIEISSAVEEYVTKKLKTLEKFLDADSRVEADLGKTTNHHRSGDIFKAEFNTNSHGQFSRVVAEDSDLYTAIDKAQNDLFDVLASKKDKKHTLWRRGAQTIKALAHGVAGSAGRKLKRLRGK
ncbi:MAG: ribosome-associated translation inhibitor RaiA [Candidatus Pacebacteria bacterium]|nr:ribosome-associated translation inhibitor RaiA [Candidatus Paceibacterota bacterium]MBP9818570.1 ribosome-associated translation inhibitor RaiA [Candidatus Paceibacterota bacterium]